MEVCECGVRVFECIHVYILGKFGEASQRSNSEGRKPCRLSGVRMLQVGESESMYYLKSGVCWIHSENSWNTD